MTCLRRGMSLAVLLSLSPLVHAAPAESGLETHVTVDVRHASLSAFLDRLSAQAKINFILTEGFEDRKVTVFLHDVTVREALEILKESKGIGTRRVADTNTFIVAPKGSPALADQPLLAQDAALGAKVTVRVKGAPLDEFLDTLSAQTQVNFVMEEGLENMKVTAFLQNVTAREALEIIMAIKGLEAKRLDDHSTYLLAKR